MLTEADVALVQQSWKQVAPISDEASKLFCARLFELDPSLRSMFPADLTALRKKVMQTLDAFVVNLHRLDTIFGAVEALGRRYGDHGMRTRHYGTVGEALLWTLEQGLSAAFTPPVRRAWARAFGTLSDIMIDASKDSRPSALHPRL